MKVLFESASTAGFINPENLSLVKIVDLPGGEKDNADPSKAGEWGQAAVDAIRNFTFQVRLPNPNHILPSRNLIYDRPERVIISLGNPTHLKNLNQM